MKKISLIPLLLSTFLLVGCETETEFDRCLAANLAILDPDEYTEKIKVYRKKLNLNADGSWNRAVILGDVLHSYWYTKLTPIEEDFDRCLSEGMHLNSFKNWFMEDKELAIRNQNSYYKYCMKKEKEWATKEKERATKVCHSQGIY